MDLTALIAARDALNVIIGAGEDTSSDNPMTAPLDQRGVWSPNWLKAVNTDVERRFPGLWMPGASIGPDGQPTTRTAIRLISGFIFQPCAKREDLTDKQREIYQNEHNRTFLAATTGDFGNVLAYLPMDGEVVSTQPGYFVASLHSIHQDPDDVKSLLLRLYRIHGLIA